MSVELLVLVSVAVAVGCLILGLYYGLADRQGGTADERLTSLVKRDARGDESRLQRRGLLALVVPRLSEGLKPRSGIEQQKLRMRLARAGFNSNYAAELFLCLKVVSLIAGGLIGGAIAPLYFWNQQHTLVCAAFSGCLMFFLPDFALRSLTLRRQEQILLALPNALDLLIVAIEVGQGLDAAIRSVTIELERNALALSQEFALYNLQLNMGRPRSEALHDLGMRSGVPDMNSFAAVLIQADRFGASIAKTMRQLSESARRKRRQMAEERAQKSAVKLIFPLVLFIFPGIFVILVGPAMIMLWRDLAGMH